MAHTMIRMAAAFAVAAALAGSAGSAEAQTTNLHIGPRVSYQFDLKKPGIGVQLGVPLIRYLEFYPSLDYFFVDVGSFAVVNADLKYRIATESINWLYVGGGLNVRRSGAGGLTATRAGVNALVGVEPLQGRIHPFGEFRFTVNNGSTAQISAGLNFTL